MRILIINTDYGPFLRDLYTEDPQLAAAPYNAQLQRRTDSLFGVADFYSRHFNELGHDCWDVHANNGAMQTSWARSNGVEITWDRSRPLSWMAQVIGRIDQRIRPRTRRQSPLRSPIEPSDIDLERILIAQARALCPDVILNQAVSEVESTVLHRMRGAGRLVVGQIASPLPDNEDYGVYDLMISSLPNFVRYYRERGLASELNRLAFDATVFDKIGVSERDIDVSFVGSVTPDHKQRFDLLEFLAANLDIGIWGRVILPQPSPITQQYQGPAWGIDMYRILGRSKITINQHIDIAGEYANNFRLFEATGMGAMLITDWKCNIGELFEPGKEVVCYRSPAECAEMIRYYRQHDNERIAIAAAGQRRTLKDHTFRSRVADLARLFAERLSSAPV